MRPADYVAQIRMERQRHKGVFLLLEGATDARRFGKFFCQTSCSVINCHGKDNVLGVIELLQDVGSEDCLGFVDADFDRIAGATADNDDVVFSRFHDFDLDVCASGVLHRYFDEVADLVKVEALGGTARCIEDLLVALKPLSALRFANQKHRLGYSLEDLQLAHFFDGVQMDVGLLIDRVSWGRYSSAEHRTTLRAHIDRYAAAEMDIWQFTNGHDFVEGLGIALRDRLGGRSPPQTWRTEVERHLRLAIDIEDFRRLGILGEIQAWEQRRNGTWTVLNRPS